MKKLFLRTMLLLCALVGTTVNTWAQNYEEIFTIASADVVSGSTYKAHTATVDNRGFVITFGGNNKSVGTNSGGRNNCKLTNYSKYAVSPVTTSSVASAFACTTSVSDVTKITYTYTGGSNPTSTKVYLLYSADNTTFSQVALTSGTQGGAISTSGSFAFAAKTGYFALLFEATNSSGAWRIDDVNVTFYKTKANDATLDHITLGGTYQTTFEQGSEFNHDGLTVTAHYDDSSSADVTGSASFSGYNMSTAGDQTVTVSYTEEGVTKTASYDITVTPVLLPVVTLDLSSNTDWGFPTSKTVPENTYTKNGYSIKLKGSSSNGYYFDSSNNNLLLGKQGATLTLPAFNLVVSKIIVYGSTGASASVAFNVFDGDDAVCTEATSSLVTHTFAIPFAHQTVGKVYTIKVTNNYNMRITKIEVYGDGCEAGLVGEAGWATYVTTAPVRYAEGDAFVVTAASDKVYMETVTDVPSNTPVVLKGAGAKTAILLDAEPAAPANELAVSTGGTVDGYVLSKKNSVVGFYKWNGGSLTSGKVYLPSSAVTSSSRDFIGFEGDVTGINEVKNQKKTVEGIFDLQGRKVVTPSKGLYIVNGKKVIIK